MIAAAHLLPGTDADFVESAYLAILGRWPDEGGLAHHLAFVRGRPERRVPMLRDMLASEEARARGAALDFAATATPAEAEAAQLRLRVDLLLRERGAVPPPAPDPALREDLSRLAAELEALGREVRDRLAALEAGLARALPLAPALSAALSVEFVQDQIEAALLRLEARLRRLEAQALEGRG
jgi:hypothetical protein